MCAQRALVCICGGRFAIHTRLFPRPAISIRTMDTSPMVCLYSAVPCVVWRMSCAYCMATNLMKTWRRGPSICIIVRVLTRAKHHESSHEFQEQKSGGFDGQNYIPCVSAPTIDQLYYCLQCLCGSTTPLQTSTTAHSQHTR